MRRFAMFATGLVTALALAGCAGDGGNGGNGGGDGGPASAGTGIIAGVVVTPAIAPLPGAALHLEPGGFATATDGDGGFRFTGLEPGSYTLTVTLAGYLSQSLAVATGQGLAKVVLEPDTRALQYVESWVHDGFVDQSANVAGARTSSNDAPNFTFEGRLPDFIQIELVWESTQAFGSEMDLTLIANDGGSVLPVAGRAEGPSPLLATLDSATIAEFGFGPDIALDLAVFVGQGDLAAGSGAGIALQQRFTVFTHMFYGYLPPDGWRFTSDGEAPPPT